MEDKRGRKRSLQIQVDDYQEDQEVRLKRFSHQVAGRNPMFELSSSQILKPLNNREAHFYERFPRCLKRFCPSYHGNATAVFDDNNEVVSFKPNCTVGVRRGNINQCFNSATQNQRLRKNLSNCDLHDDENRSESEEETGDSTPASHSLGSRVNPWSNKLHNEDFNITKKCEFIVLDNVIASYKLPCILDLKMGTQLWYPYDSERKKKNHEKKSTRTTTKSMGLRLQGLQLYNPTKSSWSYKNKYHGRDFDKQKLIDTVEKFIFEAPKPIRHHIAQIIQFKLSELRKLIESLPGYRFTGSSLLVIYDGSAVSSAMEEIEIVGGVPNSQQMTEFLLRNNLVDVKMVDFAKSTLPGFLEDNPLKGPDEGYLFGLDHLISIIGSTLNSNRTRHDYS